MILSTFLYAPDSIRIAATWIVSAWGSLAPISSILRFFFLREPPEVNDRVQARQLGRFSKHAGGERRSVNRPVFVENVLSRIRSHDAIVTGRSWRASSPRARSRPPR